MVSSKYLSLFFFGCKLKKKVGNFQIKIKFLLKKNRAFQILVMWLEEIFRNFLLTPLIMREFYAQMRDDAFDNGLQRVGECLRM